MALKLIRLEFVRFNFMHIYIYLFIYLFITNMAAVRTFKMEATLVP